MMRKALWLLAGLAVLALVVGLAGCGGGDDAIGTSVDTAGQPPPPPPPAGQKIAYHMDNAVYTMNPDGSGNARVADGITADWHRTQAILAFSKGPCIYSISASGGTPTLLTPQVPFDGSLSTDNAPDWSYDGTKVVFTRGSVYDGNRITLQVLTLVGGGVTQVYTDPTILIPPARKRVLYWPKWSPDGNFIVFYSGNPLADYKVHVLRVADGAVCDVTNARFGDWNPNPAHPNELVFTDEGSTPGLRLATFNPEAMTVTPASERLTTSAGYKPTWSPDGTQIAFFGRGGNSTNDILRISRSGGTVTSITNTTKKSEYSPDWSPVLP